MKIILHAEIFTSPNTNPLDLCSLFRWGYAENTPHFILTSPLNAREINDWLNRQEDRLRELCQEVLDLGNRQEGSATNPDFPATIIEVKNIKVPSWDKHHKRHTLSLDQAVKFLSSPFTILVENRRNDKAFLEAVAIGWRRERLKKLLANHFIEFNGGGGIGEVLKWVEELTQFADKSHRCFALFDSDAPQPNQPSQQSQEVVTTCQQTFVPHHQLKRRAIENYLSVEVLSVWATRKVHDPVHGKPRHQLLEAFKNLTNTQRYHLDMKKHFVPNIAELFKTEYPKIQESRLLKDADLMREINPVLDKIFSLV